MQHYEFKDFLVHLYNILYGLLRATCLLTFPVLLLLLSGFFAEMNAHSVDKKPDLKFQKIQEGLSGNYVTNVHQDNRGFIWAGTTRGLHLYDGIQFKIYTSGMDSTSISNNHIHSIYEDSQQRLWITTDGGVSRYNIKTDDFTRVTFRLESEEGFLVNTILEDENGRIWVSGGGSGLYYFDESDNQFIPYKDFSDYTINSITGGVDHTFWLATTEIGVIKLNVQTGETENFSHVPSDPHSISSNSVEVVQLDNDGNLWAGTNGWGINRLEINKDEEHFIHYSHEPGNSNSLGSNEISTIYVDNNNNVWIGNTNGGLHMYDKSADSFYHYDSDPKDPNSLSHNSIESIYQDSQQRYWIGTTLSGINMADPHDSNFLHYYNDPLNPNSLNNNIVRDFYENEDGSIWVATDGGGINFYDRDNDTFRFFKHDPDQPNTLRTDAVISLNKDSKGNLWAGTWGGGVNILVDEENGYFTTFKSMFNINEYPLRRIFDVHFDDDYIWLAAFDEGLYRYELSSGNIQLFNHNPADPSSLSSNLILRIFEDSQENLWIATESGLNMIKAKNKEEGIVHRYLHSPEDPSSIANVSIRQIFEDHKNNIWIATAGALSRYVPDHDHFIHYFQSDGLPSNEINSIIEDNNGNLWIGTLNGISRFDRDDNTFTNYNRSHGLQGEEFSRYSVLKTQIGEILFGGMNGFNLFQPENIHTYPYSPPVFLTDLKLFNKSVELKSSDSPLKSHISVSDTLVLSYTQNVITFEFIAINYTQPQFNQYAYMVEGFENEWNYVGSQRNATYTNLSPGDYTFKVKAANNDGLWNETGTSLALIITPPFWQTSWFYLLVAIFIAGALIAIYRIRVRGIRAQNYRLEQEVEHRTADLESTLEELKITRDELVEKAHKAGMADIAAGVLHNVGNLLNSVNTSASLIDDALKQSKLNKLQQANALLREHIDHFEEFIASDSNGKKLLNYYLMLEDPLKTEHQEIRNHTNRLVDKVNLINEVISAQQTYAGSSIYADETSLSEMIDNALSLQAGSIERHGLIVEKDLNATDTIVAQRSKMIHVLVNIFKNAKEAMANNPQNEKKLFIKTWQDAEKVYLSITDNGPGIDPKYLNKIFTQGFTTKKRGHGFGLHSSANYIAEIGGTINVSNRKNGKGATFKIAFQKIEKPQKAPKN